MNVFHMDDYLMNSDNWHFPQQVDYSINQSQFVELSNVNYDYQLNNQLNANALNNFSSASTIKYDLQLPENSSSSLKLN